MFPLVGADSAAIVIRPDAGAQRATNPTFSGNAVLETYPTLSGSVGELVTTSMTFQGDGDLTRTAAYKEITAWASCPESLGGILFFV